MNLKKTLVLFLLLCGAIFYIVKYEIPAQEAEEKKDFAFKGIERNKIESIEIKSGSESLSIRNTKPGEANSRWELSDLKGALIEPAIVNALINNISDLKLDQALPKEDTEPDLSVYGLKEPSLSIKVKSPEEKEIVFGKKYDYIGKRYLKIDGSDTIYLVPESLFTAASKKREEIRDKTPVEFVDSQLKKIEITNEEKRIGIDWLQGDSWKIVEPLEATASNADISEFNRNLRNLTASEFIDNTSELEKYGLAKPAINVRLIFKDEKKPAEEISISKVTGDNVSKYYFYIKDSPTIFETKTDPLINLSKKVFDFREKKMFEFASDLVKGFEASFDAGAPITGKKEKNSWLVSGKQGDKVFVDQWLSNLSEITASDFPDTPTDYGFGKPKYKVSIEIGEGKKILVVGKEFKDKSGAKFYYAAIDDLKVPFVISDDTYKKIALKEEALVTTPPKG